MKKEAFELIKKELLYLLIIFIIANVIFKIAFYKESLLILARNVISIFWLFVLPGYFITFYWRERLEFTERFVIGIVIAAGLIGIFSYYLGLAGFNIKYHVIVLPLAIIAAGLLMNMRK